MKLPVILAGFLTSSSFAAGAQFYCVSLCKYAAYTKAPGASGKCNDRVCTLESKYKRIYSSDSSFEVAVNSLEEKCAIIGAEYAGPLKGQRFVFNKGDIGEFSEETTGEAKTELMNPAAQDKYFSPIRHCLIK